MESDMPVSRLQPAGKKPNLIKVLQKQKYLLLLLVPGVLLAFFFKYMPIYGVIIAFKNFNPLLGITGSHWTGLENFTSLFQSAFFWRAFRNTLILNGYLLVFAFPAPILLALLLNEIRVSAFKRIVQTITYFPHFLSWVIVGGFVIDVLSPGNGLAAKAAQMLGMGAGNAFPLVDPHYFRSILVTSDIWKSIGWGTIIYLAAIAGVNPEMYEAAVIDGAGKFKQALHITIPGIFPAIVILLVLRIGRMMGTDFEQIYILYSPNVYNVGDVLSTYIFRVGLFQAKYSLTTAAGLFQSVIGFTLILMANKLSRRAGSSLF